ncbi:hypothetical protein EUX98_g8049 [Antrodiella citrinella]|uniref:Uncharacterized protein n=1 Tax=Antrodiella citrinella TaxID=2447956 RepID=A0A4S4MCB9_9APHY|nr:hypothetical protein EUX98_g8049 [Antrodiella citrinella]
MSSYYTSPPSSPTVGFFPTAPASPNAFSGFQYHQSPRDQHDMYAEFGAACQGAQRQQGQGQGSLSKAFKKLTARKN